METRKVIEIAKQDVFYVASKLQNLLDYEDLDLSELAELADILDQASDRLEKIAP